MEKKIKEKEFIKKQIESLLAKTPEGGLTHQIKNGHAYYYHQIKNPKSQQWVKTYIKKKDRDLARQLAQKEYLEKAKQILQEQLRALITFREAYNETALEQLYDNLPEERKCLVKPLADSVQSRLKAWKEEEYEPYEAYSEHKIYETDRGELVRSKSEVIIANLLYKHDCKLDYKYERPLKLMKKDNKEITVHPDFTIINKMNGKIYYYEHAGRMDDARYVIDFVSKIELYTTNEILPGRDLLITYETTGVPLSIQCVKKTIENVLNDE